MSKTLLIGMLAALATFGSACTFSHTAINPTGKTAYIIKGSSIYYCSAEQAKPVCTEIEEAN